MELCDVDLNLLVAFDVLLSELSVTRAAQRLCVGQSAMSATLSRLRDLLDDPVLERVGRGLVATPYALSLVKPIREVLDDIEAILAGGAVFDAATAQRTFTVVASDYTSLVFVAPLLVRLAQEAPGVRLWVSPPGDDYVERLKRSKVDRDHAA